MKKIAFTLFISAITLQAEGVFSVGHKNFSFNIGQQHTYGHDYTVIGASIHYFVVDNLSAGLSYQTWLGDDPSINQFTFPLTYHIPMEATYRPYIGAFYSHTYMGDDGIAHYKDYNSYGGRIGVTMQVSSNVYTSFGWVEEVYDDGINSTSRGYPEINMGISF